MDLLDQLRNMRDREAVHLPPPNFSAEGLAEEGAPQAVLIQRGIALLIASADEDVLRAYARTDGNPGCPEVGLLVAELDRRGIQL